MRRPHSLMRLVAALATAVVFLSCDNFAPPKVACDTVTVSANYQLQAPRAGVGCSFAEIVYITVAHSPTVDATWAKNNGNIGDLTLANSLVDVEGGSAAIQVCGGPDCDPTTSSSTATARIDSHGSLIYSLAVNLDKLGAIVGPGGSAHVQGVAATEEYGPGNACEVTLDLQTSCAVPASQ